MMNPYQEFQQTTIDRIIQNAYERQLQILLLADQESNVFKRKHIQQAKTKIDQQHQFKIKKLQSDFKVSRSSLINNHRMKRIKAKYELCQKLFQQVEQKLNIIICNPIDQSQYSLFLISSITQGLVRMFEPNINIRCLNRDKKLIGQLLTDITHTYNEFMIQQVGRQYPLQINISQNNSLKIKEIFSQELSHEKNRQDSQCIGGVILCDESGNITLKSTLDCRINILKQMSLPLVRQIIWTKNSGNQ